LHFILAIGILQFYNRDRLSFVSYEIYFIQICASSVDVVRKPVRKITWAVESNYQESRQSRCKKRSAKKATTEPVDLEQSDEVVQ